MNSPTRKKSGQNRLSTDEAAEEAAALRLYQESFQAKKSLLARPMAFVKGGTFDASRKTTNDTNKGGLYMPTNERLDAKLRQPDAYSAVIQKRDPSSACQEIQRGPRD